MDVPTPEGVIAYHWVPWAYITVPYKRGLSQELQYQRHGGDWEVAAMSAGDFVVPLPPQVRIEFRVRYTRAGEVGPWATGRVWTPDGFEIDDERDIKPEPSRGVPGPGVRSSTNRIGWRSPAVDPDSLPVIVGEDVENSRLADATSRRSRSRARGGGGPIAQTADACRAVRRRGG